MIDGKKDGGKDGKAKDGLKVELQEWKAKTERLTFEKNALLARLRELPAQHKKEVTALKTKLAEVTASKHETTEESQMLHALSSAVLSLYLEVKERKVLRQTDDMEIEQRQLAKTNPVVVMSYLRTHLRALLAFHEDSELDLRAQLKLASVESEQNKKKLMDDVEKVQKRAAKLQTSANEATARLEDAELAKDAALDDTRGLIEQVKMDQMTLVQQMRAKGEENEKLQQVILEKDKQLKKQETKMMQMANLESEIQSVKTGNLLERKKMEAQHMAKTASFQRDLKRQEKVLLENQHLLARVQQLEVELKKAKTSYTVMHYHDEQAKTQRLESLYRSKSKACDEADTKIKALEKQVDKCKEEARLAKEQYQKLFEVVKSQSDKRIEQQRQSFDYKRKAEQLSLSYYQDLVGQKNKEIQKLSSRIKLLSTTDVRSKLTEKRFEEEKMDLTHRLGQMQVKLEKTEQARKELLITAISTSDLDRMLVGSTLVEAETRPVIADPLTSPVPARPSARQRSAASARDDLADGGGGDLDLSASSSKGGLDLRHLTSRPSSAMSGRPQSAMSRDSLISGRMVSIADVSGDEDEDDEDEEDDEFRDELEAGGANQSVKWARELEDDNRQLRAQLKHFHNILAVSQGAADAYKAVVSSLQVGVDSNGNSPDGPASVGPGSQAWAGADDAASTNLASMAPQSGMHSKMADRRRAQINRARMDNAVAYHPARPQSAPPGREKIVSRPGSAQAAHPSGETGADAASTIASVMSVGRAVKRVAPGGGVPRPASAQPAQRPGSAMNSVRFT